jgi:hypothetical protein
METDMEMGFFEAKVNCLLLLLLRGVNRWGRKALSKAGGKKAYKLPITEVNIVYVGR